jgi:hypothetical protein
MLARFITLVAVALFALAGMAMADTQGHAVAHVYVNVNPNISVGVLTPNVDLATIQTGQIHGYLTFRCDANVEQAAFCAGVTMLYKGDDPTDPQVAPIPVDRAAGVVIAPTDANPLQGGVNVAPYAEPYNLDGFEGWMTEYIVFESSQPGYFSQDIYVNPTWVQADPEKPQGEYSGFVAFWAYIGDL